MSELQEQIQKYDTNHMYNYLKLFHEQISSSLDISYNVNLSKLYNVYSNILICGMGGSSIGSEFIKNLTDEYLEIPFNINNNYSLSNYVDSKTLLIIISYSGNTEEMISCYNESKNKNLSPYIITSGGFLLEEAKANNLNYIELPKNYPPRLAFGYMSTVLLCLLIKLKLLSRSVYKEIKVISDIIKKASDEWSVKYDRKNKVFYEQYGLIHPFELSMKLFKKQIFIYTTPKTKSIGYRFKSQLSENAKILSNFNYIPEMNHNEIEGYKNSLSSNKLILWLTDFYDLSQNIKNVKNSSKVIKNIDKSVDQLNISLKNISFISGQYLLLYYLDWVSFYLAILYETDPTPVTYIHKLKNIDKR